MSLFCKFFFSFEHLPNCTNYYLKNLNGNYLAENITTKSLSNHSNNNEYLFDTQYILSVADFCLWYDVRSTLLDMIDRVVTMNEVCHLNTQQISQSNTIQRKVRRPKTSIAIQTLSNSYEQRRNAKVQTNTVTLFH